MPNERAPYYDEQSPDPLSLEEVQREAFIALSGADRALGALIAGMTNGPQNVQRYSYAIKSRVKSVDSVVRKVFAKRKYKDPNYTVKNITDSIGVRILCLFSEDLSSTALWLLDFVSRKSDGEVFIDGGLASSVKEVIVYQPGTATESIYKGCYDKLKARYGKELRSIKFLRPDADKSYSSIHMVAAVISHHDEKPVQFGVEFQIRTALEDVWAEMDHKLFYKRDEAGGEALDLAREMMTHQKIHLDAISTTTDKIRSTCKALDRDPQASAYVRSMGVEVSIERAGVGDCRRQIRDAFDALQQDMAGTYGRVDQHLWARNGGIKFDKSNYDEFCSLEDKISDFYAISKSAEKVNPDRLEYFVAMERALVSMWKALIAASLANQHPKERKSWQDKQASETAICTTIYGELTSNPAYEKDAFVWFRLGMVHMQLRGDAENAALAFGKSAELVKIDDGIPSESQFRIVIPRLYGYALWKTVQDVFIRGRAMDRQALRSVLLKAFEVTFGLEDIQVENAAVRGNLSPEDEKRKVINNWLSYATYYLSSAGEWKVLEGLGLDERGFRKALSDFASQAGSELSEEVWALHTLTLAYGFLRDPLAQEYARRLKSALDAERLVEEGDEDWIKAMRFDAESAIVETSQGESS